MPVAPDFSRPTHPPKTYTARNLSSLSCPDSLLPQEWNLLLNDLQHAAALSKSQKTLAIGIGIATPVGCPITKGLVVWALWRWQIVRNVRLGLEDDARFEARRKRESVGMVMKRWNKRWESRGVEVALEVRGKGERKNSKGVKGRLKIAVNDVKPELAGSDSGTEYVQETEKEFERV